TDEPSLISTYVPAGLDYPKTLPWHESLPRIFKSRKGYDIAEHWESLFVDTGEIDRKIRCDFYEVIADLCAETYFEQLQDWCQAHKTMSSGHLLGEETLVWQTLFDGDPFTCYRRFDLQGIDMILSDPERIMNQKFFLVPKVASSAARLQGKRRVMCEISDFFGMMGGRHAPLAQMKCTAGVLMSLGITDFTSYYSVPLKAGEQADPTPKSRRFSVAEYRQYTDYVSRVNTFLGEGAFAPRTAVLHPIVSVWANFTPPTRSMYEPHPNERVRFIDDSFANLCRDLLQHQIDFDIVDERSVAEARVEGKMLVIGEQKYAVLVLPPMDTTRLGTLDKIKQFAEEGGSVFTHPLAPTFAAEGPDKDNQIRSMMGRIAAKGGLHQATPKSTPMAYLVNSRIPPQCILNPPSPNILCKAVTRKEGKTYFLVNTSSVAFDGACTLLSLGKPTAFDPATGKEQAVTSRKVGSTRTQIGLALEPYASLFVEF
ncbi:MAG: hypothetical protein NTZ35_06330, partial [Ignavibacteriales bacterium]|nr:hypothetical protein [Ignavibacteriales bacterium]